MPKFHLTKKEMVSLLDAVGEAGEKKFYNPHLQGAVAKLRCHTYRKRVDENGKPFATKKEIIKGFKGYVTPEHLKQFEENPLLRDKVLCAVAALAYNDLLVKIMSTDFQNEETAVNEVEAAIARKLTNPGGADMSWSAAYTLSSEILKAVVNTLAERVADGEEPSGSCWTSTGKDEPAPADEPYED